MQYGVYSIFDTKAVTFSQPFYSANNATAHRQFVETVNNNPAVLNHAGDYNLCLLGQFDDQSGTLLPNDQPMVPIANGASVINYKDATA